MKFSVVIACRNAERFIGRCLDSLVAQQSAEVRVQAIVVDGASTDGTFAIAKTYADKLELIASSEPDRGIYDAMNKGLAKATGDFVSILNADDWLLPGAMNSVLREIGNEDWIYGSVERWKDGAGVGITRPLPKERWPKEIWWQMPLPHVSLFARKSVYDRLGGFDDSYRIGGDQEWVVRLFESGIPGREIPGWIAARVEMGGISGGWARFPELYRCARVHGQPAFRVARKIAGFAAKQALVQILPASAVRALMRLKGGRFR